MGSSYKYYPVEDCENVELYQEGGFHPVEIGDIFSKGRYEIVHKLGSGAFATVWLARDNNWQRYVALKIQTAMSSEHTHELKMHQHLQFCSAKEKHSPQVIELLDHFWIDGPNGKHICLVFEVAGPSLASIRDDRKFRPDIVWDMARQVAQGVSYLHAAGIACGDLSPANVLLRLVDISKWSIGEVRERFGEPEGTDMRVCGEGELDEHAPKRVYEPIDPCKINIKFLKPEVMIIDLGEAYRIEDPTESFAINLAYGAPETVFFQEKPGQDADIWALACIWFELRARKQLFSEGLGSPYLVQEEMETAVGPLPEAFVKKMRAGEIAATKKSHRNSAAALKAKTCWTWVKSMVSRGIFKVVKPFLKDDARGEPLEQQIANIGKWNKWCFLTLEERKQVIRDYNKAFEEPAEEIADEDVDTGNPPPGPLPEAEAKDFEDALRSMLDFIPKERLRLEDLLEHPWLQTKNEGESEGPWMEQYHSGRTFAVRNKHGKMVYEFN